MNDPAHLSRLLQTGLRQPPDQTAIIFEGRTYTYDVLEWRVSALASRFAATGLAGERVGLMLPNSIEFVCCYLACFRIGAVAAPISDHYAAPELARALGVAEPKWLVVDAARRDLLAGLDRDTIGIERVVIAGGEGDAFAELLDGDGAHLVGEQPPERPVLMFFTSGSTGKPKGVLHSHRSAAAVLTSTCEALDGVGANDTILVCEPQVHPSGFIATFSVLLRGGTVVLFAGFDEDDAGILARPGCDGARLRRREHGPQRVVIDLPASGERKRGYEIIPGGNLVEGDPRLQKSRQSLGRR